MAKMTVLEMVQDILSDMDSDEVNSIDDTVESLQIAQILETTYYEVISDGDWPHLGSFFQLTASGDPTIPTHMAMADDIQRVAWIKYDKKTDAALKSAYGDITYKDPEEFVNFCNQRDSTSDDVLVVTDPGGASLLITTNFAPQFYTSFDDENIVMDSYNVALESTLQATKTQCYGYREGAFTQSDTFTPDLPGKSFSYYLAEAKSVAFNALKQAANAKEEQRASRGRRRQSQERWRHQGGIRFPNYGRQGKK